MSEDDICYTIRGIGAIRSRGGDVIIGEEKMTISIEKYRQNTLWERIELWNLIQSGLREWEAINQLFPLKDASGNRQNTSRMSKFRNWQEKGVWRPSERDIRDAEAMGLIRHIPRGTEDSRDSPDIEELRGLMSCHRRNIMPRAGLPTRDRTPTQHLAARVPTHIVRAIRSLDGPVTYHIITALELYLTAIEER